MYQGAQFEGQSIEYIDKTKAPTLCRDSSLILFHTDQDKNHTLHIKTKSSQKQAVSCSDTAKEMSEIMILDS